MERRTCWSASRATRQRGRNWWVSLRGQLPVWLCDQFGLTSYLQIQAMLGEVPFGSRNYWKSHFVRALPDDLIDEIVEHYLAHPQDGDDEILIEPMHMSPVETIRQSASRNASSDRAGR